MRSLLEGRRALLVFSFLGLGWLGLEGWAAQPASALTIPLSEWTNDDDTSPDELAATMEFQVRDTKLTLTVTNRSDPADAYNITGLFFNAASHVTGLTLVSPGGESPSRQRRGRRRAGWRLENDERAGRGFGTFDYGLLGSLGRSPYQIEPGDSWTFLFSINGTGSFSASDFSAELSTNTYGRHGHPSLVAARFFERGRAADAVYGASGPGGMEALSVPEPRLSVLLALSSLVAAHSVRRGQPRQTGLKSPRRLPRCG